MCGRGRKKLKDKSGKELNDGFDDWGGYMAAKQAKLLDQFHSDTVEKISMIFSGVRILVNGLTHPPATELKNLMAAHGGEYHMYQSSTTTHIIASNLPNVKIKHLGAVPVVKPAWITESIALNKLLDYRRYLLYTNQSRLQPALNFPIAASVKSLSKKEDSDNTSVDSKAESKITKTASDPRFLEEFYNNSRLHLISTLGAEFKQLVSQLREKSCGQFVGRENLKAKSESNLPTPKSVVMHIDMDCFFVSVGLRKYPELRGQPVAITHARSGVINSSDPTRQAIREQEFALYEERLPEGTASRVKGIKEKIDGLASMSEIASCSYEAREFGIKNGMFMGQAIKLCPNLKTLPYDFEGYKEVSNTLYHTVASYTLDIEAVSCDEMYVDVKQVLQDTGLTVQEWATHIRTEIMDITGCPCSTGFGANRLQARVATRKAKPAGQYYLEPDNVEVYMSEISLADLPGVGRATLAKLAHLGFNTCGDLQQKGSVGLLRSELGIKLGERIWEQAHGQDSKPLDFNHERKSVSAEVNYGIRFKTKEECYNFLQSLSIEVFSRLSEIKMRARGLTLKLLVRAEGAPVETAKFLGHGVCDAITKSSMSNLLYSNSDIIYKETKAIYDKLNVAFEELRGVGIQLTKLEKTAPINKALSNFLRGGASKKDSTNTESTLSNIKVVPTSETNGSPVKNPINKPKGRGAKKKVEKKVVPNKTMMSFLTTTKPADSLQSSVKASSSREAVRVESPKSTHNSLIDMKVLKELPDDIRREVMREYGLKLKDLNPKGCRDVNKSAGTSTNKVTPPETQSPFTNKPWEQVKEGIKIWIRTETEPASIDAEMLANYLRDLALDRHIEILQSAFNFLYRTFSGLSCSWHKVYYALVNGVQQGMVARYGKTLYIAKTDFSCCHNQ
ncbi:DNA repair protein Rev1 [Euwallacea fornicatus]|uniref:DNA repair protein Rev1 n=1 Tax=Euwallacea fornicatus TaxID=995702 RepID=UPI00338D7D79